jgi:Glycosyl transferase family 2
MTFKVETLKSGSKSRSGVIVFSIVRDEEYFLPHFLSHYRSLGAEEFCIYADRCNERTLEILNAQPDVTILVSDKLQYGDTFGVYPSGAPRRLNQKLKETVPEEYFPGRWVMVVDADEFVLLPTPFQSLSAFVNALEKADQFYSYAPMVDFYPGSLSQRFFDRGLAPFRGAPFFDAGPYHIWPSAHETPSIIYSGVRQRILSTLSQRYPEEIASIYGGCAIAPALNWKFPVVKQGVGIERLGAHRISIHATASLHCSLAHFKFYPDIDRKIDAAISEKQYFAQSVEYRMLRLAIERLADETLLCDKSVEFHGPESLVASSLLFGSPPEGR